MGSQIELNIPVKKMLRGQILCYFLICLYIVNGQGFGLPINESTETSPTATEVTTTLEPTTTPGPSPNCTDVVEKIMKGTECKTNDGDLCQFPFVYDGKKYDYCTKADSSRLWCSTRTDNANKHQTGNWGYCTNSCSIVKIFASDTQYED